MSMVVYYRPLPPDDGAEVLLDLHDPGIRRFRFQEMSAGIRLPNGWCCYLILGWLPLTGEPELTACASS